jgi:TPR repeat protein
MLKLLGLAVLCTTGVFAEFCALTQQGQVGGGASDRVKQPGVQISESQRKALMARAQALRPEDLTTLLEKAGTGDAEAQVLVGLAFQRGQGTARDTARAAAWLKRAAEQGHPAGQTGLGLLYMSGDGVAKDPAVAISWFRKAAELNYASAEGQLGWAYCTGNGVGKNAEAAMQWLRRGAEQGNPFVQNKLGVAYSKGECVTKNEATALGWFRKAAEQGDVDGVRNLADCYQLGHGVARDQGEAMKWYEKAAEAGDAKSQYNVGWAYMKGEGVRKDKKLAEKWLGKASEQGDGQATYYLGLMQWDGSVPVFGGNLAAMDTLEKAAAQGNPPAAYTLGEIHSGLFKSLRARLKRDPANACMWYEITGRLEGSSNWSQQFPDVAAALRNDLEERVTRTDGKLKPEKKNSCRENASQWLSAHPLPPQAK